MKIWKQWMVRVLVLTLLASCFPSTAYCEDSSEPDNSVKSKITRHQPKAMSTPAKLIPKVPGKNQKGVGVAIGIGLGAIVAVGLAVLALGSSGGGGGDGGGGDDGDTGSISVNW